MPAAAGSAAAGSAAAGSAAAGSAAAGAAAAADFTLGAADFTLGAGAFDAATGALLRIDDLEIDGPQLELWRGPTDNDRRGESGSYELGDPALTFGRGVPGPSSEARWRAGGIDRLVHRLDRVAVTAESVTTVTRISAANSGESVELTCHWGLLENRLHLTADIVPTTGWAITWPRTGIRFTLPSALSTASWFGTGPAESYPDSMRAARVGRFTSPIDDLAVRYSRPQENGHRSQLRELTVDDALRITTVPDIGGHRPGFTLTRHTPHELDAAGHPHELPTSENLYLYLDAHQHGLGSRACGIDVLPRYANRPAAATIEVLFDA